MLIPKKSTSIDKRAFQKNSNLTSITIPDSITKIESSTFEKCTSLQSITIPNSVTSICYNTFEDCRALCHISLPLYLNTIACSLFRGCTNLDFIIIPPYVAEIGYGAFENCTNLKYIYLPQSIKEIGYFAFKDCTQLQSIFIPENVEEINSLTFENCKSLSFIIIPPHFSDKSSQDWEDIGIDLNQIQLITYSKLSEWRVQHNISSKYSYSELSILYQLQNDSNFEPTWRQVIELNPNMLMHDLLYALPKHKETAVLPKVTLDKPSKEQLLNLSLFKYPLPNTKNLIDSPTTITPRSDIQNSTLTYPCLMSTLNVKEFAILLFTKASTLKKKPR